MLRATMLRISHTIAVLALALWLARADRRSRRRPRPHPSGPTRSPRGRTRSRRSSPAPRTRAAGELVVRLAFEPGADLDLYVSDPLEETAYYANTPVRSGGALDADRRCPEPGDGVETVRFAAPLAGRYRVGVDFQQRCDSDERVVP